MCDHARVHWINRQVAAGRKLSAIRGELGEDRGFYSALRRHVASHVAATRDDAPPASPPPTESDAPTDAVTVLRSVVDELRRVDVSRLAGRAKTDHLEALRRAAETLGRMAPPAPPEDEPVNVLADRPRGIRDLFAGLYSTLEPFPTLRALVARSTDPASSSRPPRSMLERERAGLLAGQHPYVEAIDALLREHAESEAAAGRPTP